MLDARSLRLELDSRIRRELRAGRGLAVDLTLDLPPGEHRLRHLVWTDSQRFGLGTTRIEVPVSEPPPVVWIPASPQHWLQVTPPGEGGASSRPEIPAGGSPTSLPVLSLPEGEERAVIEAWWRGPGDEMREGTVWLEPDGTVDLSSVEDPPEVPFEMIERRGDPRGGRVTRVSFPVPEVPPGRYRLILRPRHGAPSLPLPVVVAPSAAGGVFSCGLTRRPIAIPSNLHRHVDEISCLWILGGATLIHHVKERLSVGLSNDRKVTLLLRCLRTVYARQFIVTVIGYLRIRRPYLAGLPHKRKT